jgi:hypothetical protein
MTTYAERNVDIILSAVRQEVIVALDRFPPFHSPHEAKAVIEEELDELWELVKANLGRQPDARIEAKQVAAMAVRYMLDCDPLLDHEALYD